MLAAVRGERDSAFGRTRSALVLWMALLVLAAWARPVGAGLRDEPLPTDHWAYERIYELYASDVWGRWPIGTRPWYRGDITDRIREIRQQHDALPFLTHYQLVLLKRLESEFADDHTQHALSSRGAVPALHAVPGAARGCDDLYPAR